MSQDENEIDTLKVWVTEKGKPPKGAGLRKRINPGDIQKPVELDVWADWIPDGITKTKVADLSFSYNQIPPPVNKPPTADAGTDQTVTEKSNVVLDGSKSADTDGTITTFKWTQTAGTPLVTIVDSDKAKASFVAPDLGTVEPGQPKAVLTASPSSVVKFGDSVTLDATGSEYDVLNLSQTTGNTVSLQKISETKWTFNAPQAEGFLGFQLKATKGTSEAQANVLVQVKEQIPEPGGSIDQFGQIWYHSNGDQFLIKQSRDEATDDRWSANIEGLERGFEATMIAKSIGIASGGHFAMKQGGSNHSKGNWQDERWLDTGLRADGTVQLQWEGPHPDNHDFTLPDSKWFIKKISKGLEGNWIGLKWCQQILKEGGSPANGGVRWRMWVDENPLKADGKPANNWQLVYDFIDGIDVQVIDPQDFVMEGTMDCEVRRSDTKSHEVYAGGLHVRRLGTSTIETAATDIPKRMFGLGGKPKPEKVTTDKKLPDCDFKNEKGLEEPTLITSNVDAAAEEQKVLTFQLTVTDDKGATASDTVNITVTKEGPEPTKKPPVASFTYDPLFPVAGSVVTLDSSASTDPDGTIVSRLWTSAEVSFNNAMGTIAFFTFPEGRDSVTAKLTVTDNDGLTGSVTKVITKEGPISSKIVIGIFGDSHGENVQSEIVQKHKPNFLVHTGDVTDTEDDDDNYIKYMSDLNLKYGTDFANSQGNHESQEEGGEGAQDDMENAYPVLASTKWMQTYQVGNVFIIIGNTQIPGYSQPDNEHMTFIKNSLAKAKTLREEGKIDWIFYAQHKPFYTMKANHDPDYNFRYNVHSQFDEAGLDVSASGHVHNCQRTKPIMYGGPSNTPPVINTKMIGEAHDLSVIPHGHINTINGSSTKNASFSGSQDAWTVFADDNVNAYTILTIEGKKLTGQFIEIDTNRVLHTFSAVKT